MKKMSNSYLNDSDSSQKVMDYLFGLKKVGTPQEEAENTAKRILKKIEQQVSRKSQKK